MSRTKPVGYRRVRRLTDESIGKQLIENCACGDRLGKKIDQLETGVAGSLDVIPKTIKAIPLETACRIDFVGLVVVKQIEDHILLQTGSEESRKTNYHSIGKMRGGPFFNFKPVLSVRLCFRIERIFAFVM